MYINVSVFRLFVSLQNDLADKPGGREEIRSTNIKEKVINKIIIE